MVVDILKTLGVTELVSDALFKDTFGEIKHCRNEQQRIKVIMSCFSFLFLGVPRHYTKRTFRCWWKPGRYPCV